MGARVLACMFACGAGPMFVCESADECGARGSCEPNGGCSFPDPSCDSGRRFAPHTPSGGECVAPSDGSTSSSTSTSTSTASSETLDPPPDGSTTSQTSTAGTHDGSTTSSVEPQTSSSSSTSATEDPGSESTTGDVPAWTFYDGFERPDSLEVGNGWEEKTPAAFALQDGGIWRVEVETPFQDNLVYRPEESWLDGELVVEMRWLDTEPGYASPQCGLRVQLSSIDTPDEFDGYILFVDSTEELTLIRIIEGSFSQTFSSTLTDAGQTGVDYRLRLRVTGTDPVMLDGYLEHEVGGEWVVHTEVHGLDSGDLRITESGTLSVSGHTQLEQWVYDSVGFTSLD